MPIFSLFLIVTILALSLYARHEEKTYGGLSAIPLLLLFVAPLALIIGSTTLLEEPSPLAWILTVVGLAGMLSGMTMHLVSQTALIAAIGLPLAIAAVALG